MIQSSSSTDDLNWRGTPIPEPVTALWVRHCTETALTSITSWHPFGHRSGSHFYTMGHWPRHLFCRYRPRSQEAVRKYWITCSESSAYTGSRAISRVIRSEYIASLKKEMVAVELLLVWQSIKASSRSSSLRPSLIFCAFVNVLSLHAGDVKGYVQYADVTKVIVSVPKIRHSCILLSRLATLFVLP